MAHSGKCVGPCGSMNFLRIGRVGRYGGGCRQPARALLKPAPGCKVQWSQDTAEVSLKVPVDKGCSGVDVQFEIHPSRLKLSIKDQVLLEGDIGDAGKVNLDGCFWNLEEEGGGKMVVLTLEKAEMGHENWEYLLEGEKVDMTITSRVFMEMEIEGNPVGKIVIGLFGRESPKTVENFRCLCTGEKGKLPSGKALWYKGTSVHGVLEDELLEAGDIVNDNGTGEESIYGGTFQEKVGRIKHDGPGYVGMASIDTMGCNFYITFAKNRKLDGQTVVVGQVEHGGKILQRISLLGTEDGEPKKSIRVADCGEIAPEELEDFLDKERKRQFVDRPIEIADDQMRGGEEEEEEDGDVE